ncbi:hypothetical protein RJG79_02975 [Mycoplasmatota bacterium WC44]
MGVHQFNDKMLPDDQFLKGDTSYIVKGNKCRLLDGRRTTGIIEEYFADSAMIRWRITNYEDSGKYWDLPAEKIVRFQFEQDSKRLTDIEVKQIEDRVKEKQVDMNVYSIELFEETEKEIELIKIRAIKWFKENSEFLKSDDKIDFEAKNGPSTLASDLERYMEENGLVAEEERTARIMVLNPDSGEWIKGLKIVLAEMGLVKYIGPAPRTSDIFEGIGSKENRRRYLLHRLAFVRAYLEVLEIENLVVYRGMTSEYQWKKVERSFLPCTLNSDIGKAFSDMERESKYIISYLLRMTVSPRQVLMSFLETKAMNVQYQEAEVILLYEKEITV